MSTSVQNLPPDILYMIVCKLVGTALGQQHEPVAARPLFEVSRRWREATLPVYCRHATICSNLDRARFYRARQGLPVNTALSLGWGAFVKHATVIVSSDTSSQCALRNEIAGIGRVLANVKRVRLHIWSHAGRAGASREVSIMDVESILISLGYAFPRLQCIELEATCIDQSRKNPTRIPENAYYVYSKIAKACLCSCSLLFPYTIAPGLVDLTLELSSENAHTCISVAVNHAETLRFLNVKYIRLRDCTLLTSDLRGRHIEYSSLRRMSLDVLGAYDDDELQHRVSLHGAPFPQLEYLNCTGVYPFSDDVLIRGACKSLQKLVLAVDTNVTGWLLSDPVTGNNQDQTSTYLSKFTRLRFVDLEVTAKYRWAREAVVSEIDTRIVQMAFSLTQVVWLRVTYPNSGVVNYKNI